MASLKIRLLAFTALAPFSIPTVNAVDIQLYGNVNKAFMGYDDGIDTEATVVDNNNQSTRVGVAGEQKLDNGLTASVLLEMEQRSNPSNEISQNPTPGQSATPSNTTAGMEERMARVGLAGQYGALFLGKQDVASDDTFTHDLAAAGSIVNANVASFGGGLVFRTGNGGVVNVGGTDLDLSTMALGNDGSLASANSLRFNSAAYNGFNGSLSVSQGGNVDGALRYANTFGDFDVDTALGQTFVNEEPTASADVPNATTFASASVQHKSGFGGTFSYTTNGTKNLSPDAKEAEGYYAKVGYAWDAYGVAAEYGKFKNPVASTSRQEMDVYGIGAEYDLGHGVTTGALYRNFSADVDGVSDIQDINVFTLALGVKF